MSKLSPGLAVLALLLASASAHAAGGDGDVPVQSVEVKGVRTRLVSYKQPYEIAKKVQLAAEGRVALGLRLVPARPEVRIDDIKLWLEGEAESIPIKVSDGGVFVVPVKDQIAAQDGKFSINKKKGELTARIVIMPAIARDAWTVGMVGRTIADARSAIDKFTPWYQKPFAMRVNTVSVCTKAANEMVKVMQGETVLASLPTSEKARNDADQPVFCHHFKGDEQYDQASRLVIPDDAEVLFL
jgi:hypothetical protein